MEFPTTLTPDTDTRAGRMLEQGDVRVTVTSHHTGQHITVRFKAFADNRDRQARPDANKNWVRVPLAEATHVFVEVPTPDDEGWADKVGTFYPQSGRWYSDNNADRARVSAAAVAAAWLNGQDHDYATMQEEERCGVCARRLTDPVSIERGIGPECYGKVTGSQHQVKQREERSEPEPTQEQMLLEESEARREEAHRDMQDETCKFICKALEEHTLQPHHYEAIAAIVATKRQALAPHKENGRDALRR